MRAAGIRNPRVVALRDLAKSEHGNLSRFAPSAKIFGKRWRLSKITPFFVVHLNAIETGSGCCLKKIQVRDDQHTKEDQRIENEQDIVTTRKMGDTGGNQGDAEPK
jgi:hypothetical protein